MILCHGIALIFWDVDFCTDCLGGWSGSEHNLALHEGTIPDSRETTHKGHQGENGHQKAATKADHIVLSLACEVGHGFGVREKMFD
jgi:hypothetical protein